jgi:hypothetical protein
MLRATGRHPWRPAHIHFVVSADGYEPVTTHIFDRTDEYLGSDAVFAVKDSLICDFERHEKTEGDAARLGIAPPYYTTHRLPPKAGSGQVPSSTPNGVSRQSAREQQNKRSSPQAPRGLPAPARPCRSRTLTWRRAGH